MASGELYGGSNSNITVLLQNQTLLPYSSDSELLDSVCFRTSHPSFQGSKSLVNFERPFKEEKGDDDEDLEACFHQPGSKKRRLTSDQVRFLERNFDVENKLEPERKVQLAKELGLQPRQVAIWFQNRRARFKAKQLEKDYATLKSSYDTLKCDHDNLLQENQKLKEEVNSLKNRLIPREREKEKEKEKEKENSDDYKSSDAVNSQHNATPNGSFKVALPVTVMCKQEDVNSAKSDVVDSDSTYYCTDGNHSSSLVEPADSDFSSQDDDGEDNLSQNLLTLQPCLLPKTEDGCTYDEPPEKSCNSGFPFEDQTFCFWPC